MVDEPKGRLLRYRNALRSISVRAGAPLPSVILSFGILHEITAVIPLVGVFYAARSLGVGERVISRLTQTEPVSDAPYLVWAQANLKTWVDEGDKWASRVGQRYGFFGYEKRGTAASSMAQVPQRFSGDIANAILAYGVTKALLPVRIGASLYLSPVFSRIVVEPLRKSIVHIFRRGRL